MYKLLGMRKIATSALPSQRQRWRRARRSHHMAQMLAMVVNERQDVWDVHLPHVQSACDHSVGAATVSAPNEVHMSRHPHHIRTPLRRRPPKPRPRGTCVCAGARTTRPHRLSRGLSLLSAFRRTQTFPSLRPSVSWYAFTAPLLPFARAPNLAQAPRFSRRIYIST